MNNPIQWLEIATNDLERAKLFYEQVFKLEFEPAEMPNSKMYMFGNPEKAGSSGGIVQSEDNKPSKDGTIVYFSCEDLTDELSRVESAGGSIVFPKTDIGEYGFYAYIIDSEGNKIGLHSMK